MAAADVRRGRRPGRDHAHAPERARVRAHRPRLPLRGPAWHRQDHDGAAPGAGAPLSRADGPRALRAMRRVPRGPSRDARDVIEIDGASNRGIEEIRTLRENVKYAPARGRYKVYIIDEVHQLTEAAFNALL